MVVLGKLQQRDMSFSNPSERWLHFSLNVPMQADWYLKKLALWKERVFEYLISHWLKRLSFLKPVSFSKLAMIDFFLRSVWVIVDYKLCDLCGYLTTCNTFVKAEKRLEILSEKNLFRNFPSSASISNFGYKLPQKKVSLIFVEMFCKILVFCPLWKAALSIPNRVSCVFAFCYRNNISAAPTSAFSQGRLPVSRRDISRKLPSASKGHRKMPVASWQPWSLAAKAKASKGRSFDEPGWKKAEERLRPA